MSSMSVNSLIENDNDLEETDIAHDDQSSIPKKRPPSASNHDDPPSTIDSLKPPFHELKPTTIPSIRLNHPVSQSQPQSTFSSPVQNRQMDISQNQGLLELLGPNVSSFPFSESTFHEALKLRTEQERTKQEYYKAESANRNFLILQTALRAQIPTHLIPYMCIGQSLELSEEQLHMIQQSSITNPQPQHMVNPNQKISRESGTMGQNRSSGNLGVKSEVMQHDSFNASTVPPLGFKFGAGSSTSRPLSPAKIGAQAVANLATPTTPYRGNPSSSQTLRRNPSRSHHQRHYSMPSESSFVKSKTNTVNSIRSSRQGSQSSVDYDEKVLQSPLGLQSTLQVNPIPAQPLHKQNKSQHQPSQESMTSFQHVIQFHHWKPNSKYDTAPEQTEKQSKKSHKRHKFSNYQDSSKEQNVQQSVMKNEGREEDDDEEEANSSVDATFADKINDDANPPTGHSRQKSNIGRYPHNIMSSNK